MAEIVEMIQLSPTMEEGVIVQWLKKEGETVEAGDILAEVETDKAAMDMESFFDGVLLKIVVPDGEAAPVGTAIAVIGEEGEDVDAALAEHNGPDKSADGGKDAGDEDAGDEDAGDESSSPADAEDKATGESSASSAPAATTRGDGERIFASPVARKMAEAEGIDLSLLDGSGPRGRVVKKDVEKAMREGVPSKAVTSASAPVTAAAPASVEPEVVKLSPMRKSIAKNLAAAWQAPAFMLTRELGMDRLMSLRKELNAQLADAETGVKLSVNDLIIKACAWALMQVPAMNTAFQGDHLLQYKTADIGIAVAIDGGLITPIVRRAESKRLSEIATEVRELAGRARDKKLAPEEYTGSTFSISNLGMFGIDHFTAVLNPPAAGILAVGTVKKQPVVADDGSVVVAQRMNVTLTCDHRAVDGAVGAQFLQALARAIENPMMMLV